MNQLKVLQCGLLSFSLAASSLQAAVISGPILNPSNGHNYYLLEADSWTASEAEANTLGGHLATINDAAENDWVYDTFSDSGQRNLWIGWNDAAVDGTFVWSSGESASYTNWSPFEPSNGVGGTEDYTQIVGTDFSNLDARKWNDIFNSGVASGLGSTYGVVEVVPEPATLGLLIIGGLATLCLGERRPR